jgi:superfamily I DNA and RNA helicase
MPIEFIPARVSRTPNGAMQQLITRLRDESDTLGLSSGIMYYGWPKFTDYDANRHYVDLAIITPKTGVTLIRVLPSATPKQLLEAAESISQATATAMSQLMRSPILRTRGRQLKVAVVPAIFAPGFNLAKPEDVDTFDSENSLVRFLGEPGPTQLSDIEYTEVRSILEGAKALVRPNRRIVADPNSQQAAQALSLLEDEIASFDQRQRHVALSTLGGPERIRGLAGSGKTVILAMKAALAHLDNPQANILITYYTRALKDHLTRLVTRFHRHFGEGEPDWKRIHIHHGWGKKDIPGVNREASLRAGFVPITYTVAAQAAARGQSAFDYACRTLLDAVNIQPFYDLILIDEGQDFPSSFYELCFHLAKGNRDQKQIVWAYDELQNIFDVKVRTPTELFGADDDGEARIDLKRSLPAYAETNDFVLPKCYRNQRDVLVLAHATGFGIYGQAVQMLQDKAHWEDVGYEVTRGDMRPGEAILIERPEHNSPTQLHTPASIPLVEVKSFSHVDEEVSYCADEFAKFISGGLLPEDMMAIAIDDRAAKLYLSKLAESLAERGIASNNMIADRYSEPAFLIEGRCTLSTVYKAKGNEAAVVAVLGCDAVNLRSRSGRNRLFTAFTRTKGWLRISGMRPRFGALHVEIKKALDLSPAMKFAMPDPAEIELIQRDLSEKDARIQRAREEVERLKDTWGLSDDDLRQVFLERGRNGPS